MYPPIFLSVLQPNIYSPVKQSPISNNKKRIPPFHPDIDDQTGPAKLSKKIKAQQPSELFADIAENLFSYYSDLSNMKRTNLPQIFQDNNLLTQSQSQSCSNLEQVSALSLLLSSENSSYQNSAKKSTRSDLNKSMIKEEESETASNERSLVPSRIFSENSTQPLKNSKEVFKITRQDGNEFHIEKRLEFVGESKNESPLKTEKSSQNKSDVSVKQDELKSRLDDIFRHAQVLLDTMKETVSQAAHETPQKSVFHEPQETHRHPVRSQEIRIHHNEIKIEPKIEEDEQIARQITLSRPEFIEPQNHVEIRRNSEIRRGEEYQVNMENILKKKNKHVGAKLVWNPEQFSEEELVKYEKGIKKIIKGDVVCEEKALKVLMMTEMDVEKALREIKENSRYYISHLKANVRSLRSHSPSYWAGVNHSSC